MDNKILFGVMTLIFNEYGVPNFMSGDIKTGILRIVLGIVTFGVIACINFVMGIIMGIKILTMSDEDYQAQKETLFMGVPKGGKK